jgi:surface polysaccharide O-acyltransferase-like enzyme
MAMGGQLPEQLQGSKPSVDYSVNLIRTIAIIVIILVHVTWFPYKFVGATITNMDIVNWFTTDTYAALGDMLGVPLFIMLSGALLLVPEKADEPARVFYKKRFNRIGVPLIFWSLVYFAWMALARDWTWSLSGLTQKILVGPYYHFWFLYVLIGLYAVTPILRVLVKHLQRNLFTVLMVLWFLGEIIPSMIFTFTDYSFDPTMFILTDWVGYYLLGVYLLKAKISRSKAAIGVCVGLLGAVLGECVVAATLGENYLGYFHHYSSFSIIIGSASVFILLLSIPKAKIEKSKFNPIIQWIGQNSLPLYLVHALVIDIFLQYLVIPTLGNKVLDAPVLTVATLGLSILIIYLLKKIPYLAKLVG